MPVACGNRNPGKYERKAKENAAISRFKPLDGERARRTKACWTGWCLGSSSTCRLKAASKSGEYAKAMWSIAFDGRLLVVGFTSGLVRGYARFDHGSISSAEVARVRRTV